jgi:GNAT superfamily N-acetyltransferase
MVQSDIGSVARLIGHAMNADEGKQALDTFDAHFSSKSHGIDDGRSYYVLAQDIDARGVVGLHQYLWGPPENVWLAWFAVDPELHGRGLGAFLLDAITHKAKQLGYMKFFIETYSTPEFDRARAFYRAKGFT